MREALSARLVIRLVDSWSSAWEVIVSPRCGMIFRVPLPPDTPQPPDYTRLLADLRRWRQKGVLQLRRMSLQALVQAALAAGEATTASQAAEPAVLRSLLREALAPIAHSVTARCAAVLLGLDPATFDVAPHALREDAAQIYGVSLERFRKEPQEQVLAVVADAILERCFAHQARLGRLALERRHPAESRLAVKWLERFEAYFAIWTPIYALGADLTAYRSTLLDSGSPVEPDQVASTSVELYTFETQADGYALSALYRLASVTSAEQRFIIRYGGMWLLSSFEAEVDARDALYTLTRHLPTNERDHSWLRVTLTNVGDELHPFLIALSRDEVGRTTIDEWRAWLEQCGCEWRDASHDEGAEYFPTARYHSQIDPQCPVHQTIEACSRYCSIIEQEWLRVADWYRFRDSKPQRTPQTTLSQFSATNSLTQTSIASDLSNME